jgi:hypothetical protein
VYVIVQILCCFVKLFNGNKIHRVLTVCIRAVVLQGVQLVDRIQVRNKINIYLRMK